MTTKGGAAGSADARRPAHGPLERLAIALAACVCLLFTVSLRDLSSLALTFAPPEPLPTATGVPRDAALSIKVTTALDEPVAGADVSIFSVVGEQPLLSASVHTGADGTALVTHLPHGETWLLVRGSGHARASTRLALGPGLRQVLMQLDEGHTFEVVVVDVKQRPIRGVQVTLHGSDPLAHRTLTDGTGLARFEGLDAGPYAVEARANGFDAKLLSRLLPGDSPAFVRLERMGALTVSVVDGAGKPAPAATVTVTGSSLWPARSATTDAAGTVTIAGLGRGFYDLRAELGDQVSEIEYGVMLERGERRDVELTLVDGVYVRVVVTDGDEGPGVRNADVALVEGGLSSFPLYGRTDAIGLVVLGPVASTDAVVSARAEGFVAASALPLDDEASEVRIPLVRGATLAGRVVDQAGYPIDGARLEVVGVDPDGMPISESSTIEGFRAEHFAFSLPGATPLIPVGELGVMPLMPEVPHDHGPLVVRPSRPGTPWLSASDGSFELSPVPPGSVRVVARHPGYVEAHGPAVRLASGGQGETQIVMYRGGMLEGRVLEQDRSPVAGARVELSGADGTVERVTFCTDDGSFAFASLPEEVRIGVSRPDSPENIVLRMGVDLEGRERTEIEVVLPARRDEVLVRVSDDRGYPLDHVELHVLSLEPSEPLERTLFSDDAGEARLPDGRGLPLRIVATRPGKAPAIVQIDAAPAEIGLTMPEPLVLEGTVVGDGAALEGVKLTLLTPSGPRHARSDRDGTFRFRDLGPSESQRLLIIADGFVAEERRVAVRGEPERPIDLGRIELERGGVIMGEVLDAENEPVAGARVAAGRVPTYLPMGPLPVGVAATDRRGRFVLADVAPGTTVLEAYVVELGRAVTEELDIRAGRTLTGVRIVIAEDAAEPAPAMRGAGSVAVTLSEHRGTLRFEYVPPGGEAERAGVEPGDVLLRVDGVPPRTLEQARLLLTGPLAEDVVLTLRRPPDLQWAVRVRRERLRR